MNVIRALYSIRTMRISIRLMSLLSLAVLAACNNSSGSKFNSSITTPSSSNSTTGGSGTVTRDAFKITVGATNPDTSATEYFMHKFWAYSTQECSISSDTKSNEDIICMVNVPEFDLASQGLTLRVNVPAGMCQYLRQRGYYYFNYKPGYCASAFTINLDANGAIAQNATACTITDGGRTWQKEPYNGVCVLPPYKTVAGVETNQPDTYSEGSIDATGKVTCVYDYTDQKGPNCAFGAYVGTINPVKGSSSTVKGNYGGEYKPCMAGPVFNGANGWVFSDLGFPSEIFTHTYTTGFNKDFVIPSATSVNKTTSNLTTSNMHHWNEYRQGKAAWLATSHPMFDPNWALQDYSGTVLATKGSDGDYHGLAGHDSIEYLCTDEHDEIKHRIRVYVNEWDSKTDYQAYKTKGELIGGMQPNKVPTPDWPNDVEAACESATISSSTFTYYCNDYWDWDDLSIYNNYPPFPGERNSY